MITLSDTDSCTNPTLHKMIGGLENSAQYWKNRASETERDKEREKDEGIIIKTINSTKLEY